jgi:hypothetical protein
MNDDTNSDAAPGVAQAGTAEPVRWGATPDDWAAVGRLGLTEDSLPVVSNPTATISNRSTIKKVGKTPSIYNRDGKVVGILDWPSHHATRAEFNEWNEQPHYGLCIQTRRLRAADIDVEDAARAEKAWRIIVETVGSEPPRRTRSNSNKFLVPMWVDGEHPKRTLRLPGDAGIIEFLGDGQQFIAAGTHPSGVRYTWSTGDIPDDPDEFPRLEPEEYEALLLRMRDALGATEGGAGGTVKKKRETVLSEAAAGDPVAVWLHEQGRVLDIGRDGQLFVECPNKDEHTTESGPTATCYYPAHTGGYAQGNWKCLHGHCDGKPASFFTNLLDMVEFPDLSLDPEAIEAAAEATARANASAQAVGSFLDLMRHWTPKADAAALVTIVPVDRPA